jgi:hypothetical protein
MYWRENLPVGKNANNKYVVFFGLSAPELQRMSHI